MYKQHKYDRFEMLIGSENLNDLSTNDDFEELYWEKVSEIESLLEKELEYNLIK